jgi:hypothetical protein
MAFEEFDNGLDNVKPHADTRVDFQSHRIRQRDWNR